MFLQENLIAPGDRVMAGLVAFDASCEEMWLAPAVCACLVLAPSSLVRSGMDLAPWLTGEPDHHRPMVPPAALWPIEALGQGAPQ